MSATRSASVRFLYDSMNQVWVTTCGCEEGGHYVAEATLPGHLVLACAPGLSANEYLQQASDTVAMLTNHWDPVFLKVAGRYGLNEEQLRAGFNATQVA